MKIEHRRIMHAWYSREAAKRAGIVTYLSKRGKPVRAVFVSDLRRRNGNWPDMVYVGRVMEGTYQGRIGPTDPLMQALEAMDEAYEYMDPMEDGISDQHDPGCCG